MAPADSHKLPMVILKKTVSGLTRQQMEVFLRRAKRLVNLRGEVNVLVTSSAELQSLNRQFRGKNKSTDVLSFPAPSDQPKLAGDIAIAAPIAAENARLLKHSSSEEIKVLVLHGLLHLAGYDHESDTGAMAKREASLRAKLKLPIGLIERNSSAASHASSRSHPARGESLAPARRSRA
jgi:probable rRNA maturation factor